MRAAADSRPHPRPEGGVWQNLEGTGRLLPANANPQDATSCTPAPEGAAGRAHSRPSQIRNDRHPRPPRTVMRICACACLITAASRRLPVCLATDAAVNGGGAKPGGGGGGAGGAARDGSRSATYPRETFLADVAPGGRTRSDMRWLLMARASRPIRSGRMVLDPAFSTGRLPRSEIPSLPPSDVCLSSKIRSEPHQASACLRPHCIICIRNMHIMHILDFPACIICIRGMHNMHIPDA